MTEPAAEADIPIEDADPAEERLPQDDPKSDVFDDSGSLPDLTSFTGWPDVEFVEFPPPGVEPGDGTGEA
jgi:hypothetical protein